MAWDEGMASISHFSSSSGFACFRGLFKASFGVGHVQTRNSVHAAGNRCFLPIGISSLLAWL